jgi:hypothetical protein
LTPLFYCDVCGDFEGPRQDVEEHVDEEHDELPPGADPVVKYPFKMEGSA